MKYKGSRPNIATGPELAVENTFINRNRQKILFLILFIYTNNNIQKRRQSEAIDELGTIKQLLNLILIRHSVMFLDRSKTSEGRTISMLVCKLPLRCNRSDRFLAFYQFTSKVTVIRFYSLSVLIV